MAKKPVAKPVKPNTTNQIMADTVDAMSDEEVLQTLDLSAQAAALPVVEEEDDAPASEDVDRTKVRVTIPVFIEIAGRQFAPGTHIVENHMIPTIMEIVDKKRRADLSMFTGKNFLVERLLDRTLSVKEVGELDLKKMAR